MRKVICFAQLLQAVSFSLKIFFLVPELFSGCVFVCEIRRKNILLFLARCQVVAKVYKGLYM